LWYPFETTYVLVIAGSAGKEAPMRDEVTPVKPHEDAACTRISELLARVGDKWTLLVVRALGERPLRFNALRREVGEISQKMLASTLRNLERDGFVSRTVTPTQPPQVEYALTTMGRDLQGPVAALAQWTLANAQMIEAARTAYDRRNGA
jgi:DNA-binding HxlR family transcriptional regulator